MLWQELNKFGAQALKSDTVAVLAVLPRYPRYYRGNGYKFYGITTVLGSKCAGIPWVRGPCLTQPHNPVGRGGNGDDFHYRITLYQERKVTISRGPGTQFWPTLTTE